MVCYSFKLIESPIVWLEDDKSLALTLFSISTKVGQPSERIVADVLVFVGYLAQRVSRSLLFSIKVTDCLLIEQLNKMVISQINVYIVYVKKHIYFFKCILIKTIGIN